MRNALMCVVLLLSVAVSVLSPAVAHAATAYTSMSPDNQVRAYLLYYATAFCFDKTDWVSNSDVLKGAFPGAKTNSVNISYYIDHDQGKYDCGEVQRDLLTVFGYSNIGDAMKSWGYRPPHTDGNNSDNWVMQDGKDPRSMIQSALDAQIYQAGSPAYTAANQYLFHQGSLINACKLDMSSGVEYNSATDALKAAIANNDHQYVKVTEVQQDASKVDKIYKVGAWGSYVEGPNFSMYENSYADCGQMASKMSKFASQYAALVKERPADFVSPGIITPAATSDSKSTCGVAGVGWIVCPVMNFLAGVMDGMFGYLSDNFLSTNPELVSSDSPTYKAWDVFRSYANVAFVIVFLIIIYAQITSVGISNYGIKRMLPRLVIAAVLVNISYYLCQLAVDVSNILGFGINQLFEGIIKAAAPTSASGTGSTVWVTVVGGILVVGAGLLLALMSGIILPALLALAMIVLILLARKALIVILIVLSPLAFVAYLLPNTEDWFKKWWKMFSSVLMVFPVVAVVFGGSKLASAIIGSTAGAGASTDSQAQLIQLTALGVSVIPLFVVPGLLKGSLSAAGKLGTKLQGWGDKATSRTSSKAKARGSELYKRSSYAQGKEIRKSGKDQFRRGRFAAHVTEGGLRGKLAGGVLMGKTVTPGGGYAQQQLERTAQAQAEKDFEQDVSASNESIKFIGFDDVKKMANAKVGKEEKMTDGTMKTFTEADVVAAKRDVLKRGSMDEKIEAITSTAGQSGDEHKRVRQAASEGYYSSGMSGVMGAAAGGTILETGIDDKGLQKKTIETIKVGKVKAENSADAAALAYLDKALQEGLTTIDPNTGQPLLNKSHATTLQTSVVDAIKRTPQLSSKITGIAQTNMTNLETTISNIP